jgi:uncharacterized membrane protein
MAQPKRAILGLSWPGLSWPGVSWPDLFVLLVYVAMLGFAIPHYQRWEDEGRAWMLARVGNLWDLIFHFLRYEGHPAVWYVLLWPFAQFHMPFIDINWISAACATAGIYILLRLSPFPFYLRALLPFGFTLAYQEAIVARSYVLFPLFGFLIAHEYRQTNRRPVRMAICLALLANLSVHGTMIACVFGAAYAWDLFKERRRAEQPGRNLSWSLTQARWAAGIFAGSLLFLAVVLWPPKDLQPPVDPRIGRVLHHVAPAAYPLQHRRIVSSSPLLLRAAGLSRRWVTGAEPQVQPVTTTPAINLGMGVLPPFPRLRTVFLYPVASFAPLALLFQALVFLTVWRRGKPILIAGHLLLGAFIFLIYFRIWHTSLIWISLVMLLWAVWDERQELTLLPRPAFTLQNSVAVLFTLVCLLQLRWTFDALRFERSHSTYPAQAVANYLKSLPPNTRIDGFDHSLVVLPYFDRDPFHLEAEVLDVPAALDDRPDVILYRENTVTAMQLAQLEAAGYRNRHDFCGAMFFPDQPIVPLCLVILEKP